jgi:hypothetical protein
MAPSMSFKPSDVGPPIGDDLRAQAKRRTANIKIWMEVQGARIRNNRPEQVYAACLLMALERCSRADWQHLTPAQIEECDMRAVSQARVRMFGPKLPPTNEDWDSQIAEVRASWAQPKQEAA